ncbi:MAG: macrolide ABC transporter ATP-binding protein [Candidatus Cloacimonadota bacterium]|nr:MAG: macrolide ABC transporter ATP-binding protein [Candidatus Cloacimonadota bacterium]
MELFRLENIKKEYKNGEESLKVLKGISFTISDGDFVSIMGRSGAGKSTLLQIIGCLDAPSSGKYFFDKMPIHDFDDDQMAEIRNQKIGFVFQSFYLLPYLSVLQNVMMPMEYSNISLNERRERALHWLCRFQIDHRKDYLPRQLSGGEKQRVALARSMVNQPKLLLADEPTGNLDLKVRDEVIKVFHSLNEKEKTTIIMVTHDDELGKMTPRTINLRAGLLND